MWRVIRHADPAADAAACAEIYAPYVTSGVASFEDEAPGAAEMERRIAATAERYPWLVAERDGAVAGYAYGTVHRTPARVPLGGRGDGLRRRAPAPRRASAASSTRRCCRCSRASGCRSRCAGITLPNDASVALHESLGFQPVGIYRDFGYKFGAWHDVGWWQARLAPVTAEPQEPLEPQRLG